MRLMLLLALACGDSTYDACGEAADCEVPEGAAEDAEAACLSGSEEADGICTYTCGGDDECGDGEVCSPFESEDLAYCFVSCEELEEGETEEDRCGDGATCRSTGGGSDNRKICFPNE